MNTSPTKSYTGFTLIELMISIAVLGVLMGIAVPSFQTWLRNTQIRNAAESITSGLQRARGEAVARNTNVNFILGSGSDSSWTINVVTPASQIMSSTSAEGAQNVTRTVLPSGATTITFNNLGVVVTNADSSGSLQQVDLTTSGGTRDLRVTIGVGGNARMCDPNLVSGSSPSAC